MQARLHQLRGGMQPPVPGNNGCAGTGCGPHRSSAGHSSGSSGRMSYVATSYAQSFCVYLSCFSHQVLGREGGGFQQKSLQHSHGCKAHSRHSLGGRARPTPAEAVAEDGPPREKLPNNHRVGELVHLRWGSTHAICTKFSMLACSAAAHRSHAISRIRPALTDAPSRSPSRT